MYVGAYTYASTYTYQQVIKFICSARDIYDVCMFCAHTYAST